MCGPDVHRKSSHLTDTIHYFDLAISRGHNLCMREQSVFPNPVSNVKSIQNTL